MTVSQTLRGVGRIGPGTRKRIIETAAQLGYRPNSAAKAISTGRFNCAALLLGTQPNRSTLPSAVLRGIHDALVERGMHLSLAILPDEKLTSEGVVPRILQQWTADGLIINYTDHIPERMIELIRDNRLPSTWINSTFDVDCIRPDDLGAGMLATEHLLALGHRSIAYLDFSHGFDELPIVHYSARDRQTGYERVMLAAGLKPCVVRPPEKIVAAGRVQFAEGWFASLRQGPRPTAIITYGSGTALPVMLASARCGFRIPEDISLVDFSGSPMEYVGPIVTTVLVPEYELGRQAVEMLMRKLDAPSEPVPARIIRFGFDAGATAIPHVAPKTL